MLINYSVWLSALPPPSLLVTYYALASILSAHNLYSLSLSQGYEDWLRHKADDSINECPVDVVQQGKAVRTQSHKLRVRMASLEQHSTWGHKAQLSSSLTVSHTPPSLSLKLCSLPLPLCLSVSLSLSLSLSLFLSLSRLSFPPINCPETVVKGQI